MIYDYTGEPVVSVDDKLFTCHPLIIADDESRVISSQHGSLVTANISRENIIYFGDFGEVILSDFGTFPTPR